MRMQRSDWFADSIANGRTSVEVKPSVSAAEEQ